MKKQIKSLFRFFCNVVDTPAVSLLYHRVTDLPLDPQQLSVSPDNFADHIAFLKREYNLLSVEEFSGIILSGKKMPKRSVVITFDDGYADNFYKALPILADNKAQALFYISTSLLDTRGEFWWDSLERVFLEDHEIPKELLLDLGSHRRSFNTSGKADKTRTYEELLPLVKNNNIESRDGLMKKILTWSGLPVEGRESHRVLTHNELISMAKSPSAIIGAHTHSHPKLSACSFEEQLEDIRTSKVILERFTGRTIEHFSYPFGTKEDYNAGSIKACKELGFKIVSANYHNQVHRWHSRYELPRVLVRNWPIAEFSEKMDSFFRF